MVEILVPLGFFGMIVGIVYIQARKKVHLTLIQQRVDAETLKTDKDANGALKFGMLMVGVALGILLGNYLSHFMQTEAAFFSMVLIFGGISLLVYYFVIKQEAKKERMNKNEAGADVERE
jgi:predicted MFS family arabinose efflux permease